MTDAPLRPKRRGRRVIVIAVLVLASMVAWWHYPRGDARFVGRWTLVDRYEGEPLAVMWLRANGGGWSAEGGQQMYFTWHASDTELTVGHSITGPIDRAVAVVAEALLKLTGRTFSPGEMKFRVLSISADRIEMIHEGGATDLSLERIPE
jgi:hypothetical protein